MNRRSFIAGSLLVATGGAQLAATATAPTGAAALVAAEPGGPRSCAAAPAAPRPTSILALNPPETILPVLQNMQMRAIKPVPRKPPVYQQEQLTRLLYFG